MRIKILFVALLTLVLFNVKTVLASSINGYSADTYLQSGDDFLNPNIHDVNGDTKSDLILVSEGNIYVYFNGNTMLGQGVYPEVSNNYNLRITNTGIGFPTDALEFKDINNDGKDDTIFQSDRYVYIIDSNYFNSFINQVGQSVDLTTNQDIYFTKIFISVGIYSQYGKVLFSKDVNGDTKNDLIVLAEDGTIYYFDNSLLISNGTNTVLDVAQSSDYNVKILRTDSNFSRGGGFVLEDISNDGKPDFIVAIENFSGRGSINIILGSKITSLGGTGNSISITNDLSNTALRIKSIASNGMTFSGPYYTGISAADLNNDGKNELLTGSSLYGNGVGKVNVYSNSKFAALEGTTGTDISADDSSQYLFSIIGQSQTWSFSENSHIVVGDINENSLNDLVIGNQYDSTNCSECGAAYVIDDSILTTLMNSQYPNNDFSLTDGNNYLARISGLSYERLGSSNDHYGAVKMLDINTDGHKDLIVHADGSQNLYMFMSYRFKSLGTTKNNQLTVTNVNNFDRKILSVNNEFPMSFVGELTGDEANELILGWLDVYVFKGGYKIKNLNSSLTTTLRSSGAINPVVEGQVGVKDVILRKDSVPVSSISTKFANIEGLDWSGITADTNIALGKTVVTNINSSDGVVSHDVYVKKLVGAIGIRICPNATILEEVTLNCDSGTEVVGEQTGLSSETIDSVEYWKVSNTQHTGVMNILDTTSPSGSVSITSGLTQTNSRNVGLTLSATDSQSSVTSMMVSIDQNFVGASWESYSTSKSITVSSDGQKSIYVKFRDSAGNVSDVYSTSINVDTIKPSVTITQLGLINNIPDKSPLFYYFTSQTPVIKGKSEPNSTVHFLYDSNDYVTETDSNGDYRITIPELPRKYVVMNYYAIDKAGNKSNTKILKFVIGEENFPEIANEKLNNSEVTTGLEISLTPTPSVIPPTDTDIPETPNFVIYEIVDEEGKSIGNVDAFIDGQKYVADKDGKIIVESGLTSDQIAEVSIGGKLYGANILQNKLKVIVPSEKANYYNCWLWLILVLLIIIASWYYYRRKKVNTK